MDYVLIAHSDVSGYIRGKVQLYLKFNEKLEDRSCVASADGWCAGVDRTFANVLSFRKLIL